MKKLLTLLCMAMLLNANNAQIIMPGFGDTATASITDLLTTDTPDIAQQLIDEKNAEKPTSDSNTVTDEMAIKKLELEAQRLKLEKEIAELRGRNNLTLEEKEVLKLKNDNLRIVALKEQMLLQQELEDMKKASAKIKYPESNVYGHDFFRNGNFAIYNKTNEVVASENYILGTGDVVQLEVWGYRYWSKSYTISESGAIDISGYQKIFVKGMTLKQARNAIGSRLGLTGNESSYSISVTRPRMVSVNVLGEVFNPGTYTLPATNSAFNVLVNMGGPSNIGSVRNIYIKRDGKIRDSFDTYEYFANVMHQKDVFLQNNDYIIVAPQANIINIGGSVRRPGNYELKNGEGLLDLIKFAGGANPNAFLKDVVVTRIKNNAYEVISVNLDSLQKKKKDFSLTGGESVVIKAVTQEQQFLVQVSGAVSVPGSYRVKQGMRISSVIRNANGLKPEAYLEKGYIVRTNSDNSKTYMTFAPGDVVKNAGTDKDILVESRDTVYIFNSTDITEFTQISIKGAVFKPFTSRYINGIKLGELLFMAGGLTPEADSKKGFIIRTNSEFDKQLIQFEPAEVLANGNMADFELLPRDEVTIYSKTEFKRIYNLSVEGPVKSGGTFAYTANTKVSDLINLAGGLETSAYKGRAIVISESLETGIKTSKTINLENVLKNPSDKDNVLLQPNDVVRIFDLTELKNNFQVSVYGEVKRAGEYDYSDNMTLQNLIDLSGGIGFIAAGTEVEIVRNLFVKEGSYQFLKPQVMKATISPQLGLEGQLQSFVLQPFDKVFVRRNPDYMPVKLVYLEGAVKYPGFYALQGENERMSSILKRAGGFRADAMRSGIQVLRPRKPGDTIEVVVNSVRAMRNKRSKFNVIVKGGDKIFIPFAESLVYISGDVNKNSDKDIAAYYKSGKRAKYYIRNFGGGFNKTSDKRRVVVQHANGARVGTRNLILFKVYPRVRSGSKVIVKSKTETQKSGPKFNLDNALNKFITRTTAVLTLVGLIRIATAR